MKKLARGILCCVSAAVMTLAALPMSAYALDIDWYISTTGVPSSTTQATILGYYGKETDLVCPDTFAGAPIKEINNNAMKGVPLNSFRTSSNIKSINASAFENCGLTELYLMDGNEVLKDNAFRGNNLTYVAVPSSVHHIGNDVFADNPNLEVINMVGRSSLSPSDISLGTNWSGTAKVVFDEPLPDTPPLENGDSANIAVEGTVEPVTSLNLDVPVKTTFLINADRDFVTAPFQIINHSPMPVKVSAASIAASEGTSAKVVEHDAYTNEEWNNLSAADTQSKIALGLQVSDSSAILGSAEQEPKWFGAEGSSGVLELGTIKSAHGLLDADEPPTLSLEFQAKYGKLWGDVTTLSYDMVLSFSAE